MTKVTSLIVNDKYSAKYGLVKDSNDMPDNVFPSCQMVQSAYYEMYDCYCNHYIK